MKILKALAVLGLVFSLGALAFFTGCASNNSPTSPAPVTVNQPVTLLVTATNSPTGSATPTPSFTSTLSITPTSTITFTPTSTYTPVTILVTSTFTQTFSPTNSTTVTPSFTPTNSPTDSPTQTLSNTVTPTDTFSSTATPTLTPTVTPLCGSPSIYGSTATSGISIPANYIYGNPVTVTAGPVTAFALAVFCKAAGNGECGIYLDNSGSPGWRVTSSGSQTMTGGWNTLYIPPLQLVNGTYWVAVVTDTPLVALSTALGTRFNSSGSYTTLVHYPVGVLASSGIIPEYFETCP